MVYFLKHKNLIKIGYTKKLASRIDALQRKFRGSVLLKSIAGFREKEKELHKIFNADHAYGEWFNATPALMAYIHLVDPTADDLSESPDVVLDKTLKQIGNDVKCMRLKKNLTQEELRNKIGVSLTAIRHLEEGSGSSLRVFAKAAVFLGKQGWFDLFSPYISINPLNMVRGKPRMRATGRRGN